jgi:glycosyltransferase involved in cell wall biosynthesis
LDQLIERNTRYDPDRLVLGCELNRGMQVEASPRQTIGMIVAIPARNEACSITTCLNSLLHQVDLNGRPVDPLSYEIIVLLNNCTDESASVIREFIGTHDHGLRPVPEIHLLETYLPIGRNHVGWARRLVMDEAYRRFQVLGYATGIIATTDADSTVSPYWIAATQAEIAQGAHAVGGRLLLSSREEGRLPRPLRTIVSDHRVYERLCDQLAHHIQPDPADPWPRHTDHGGASLALTAAAYEAVGGVPPIPGGEDDALYRGLRRIGARFRHSNHVRVFTSGRLLSRANGGMATQLTCG